MIVVVLITTVHGRFPDPAQQHQVIDSLPGIGGGLPSDVLYEC